MESASLSAPKLSAWASFKFILLASAGFMVDGYLNLVIGLVTPMLGYLYYPNNKNALPADVNDAVSGITNLGIIVGQLVFGLLADRYGRSSVYGKELLITIFGTVMTVVSPTQMSAGSIMAWLSIFRFVTGIGIGGDYPVSGALTVERRLVNWRGAFITVIFGIGQGAGRLVSGVLLIILVYGFKSRVDADIKQVEYVWRLLLGLGVVPAMFAVYGRLKIRETVGYKAYVSHQAESERTWATQWKEFSVYYSRWRNIKVLFSLAFGWCLFDIAFYGINLNQGTVLTNIGLGGGSTPWEVFKNQAVGNMATAVASWFGGIFLCLLTVDPIGRVRTQTFMLVCGTLFYAIWAGMFNTLSKSGVVAMYWLSSMCLSYLSMTIYILPAEVFPTRVRGTSQGICAASGKIGALISGFAFNKAKQTIGFSNLIVIFAVCLGAQILLSWWIPEPSRLTLEELELDIMDLPKTYGRSMWFRGLIPVRVNYEYDSKA